jgi:hypothetical protein
MGGPEQDKEQRRSTRKSAANDIDVKREPEAAGSPPSKRVKIEPSTPKKKSKASKARIASTPPSKGGPMMDIFSPVSPGDVKEGVNSSTIALFNKVSVHSLLLFPII